MRLFRREWVVPALAVAFVSASAHASRDALSAQAAEEMRCNSVSLVQSSANEFLAVGCGKEWTYDCEDDGACSSDDALPAGRPGSTPEDDAAAEAVASALTDLACACASGGVGTHGSHHARSSASASHHKKR